MASVDAVKKAIEPILIEKGFELVDVEYTAHGGAANLTVYIDKLPGGITLDDCEIAHYAIDPVIDEVDPTNGKPYTLNVSSPGLDRHFKTPRDYERNYGKEVEVKLYAPLKGKKVFEGVLLRADDGVVVIEENGKENQIEKTRIAFVRPLVKFE